jgi:hypothetical protein
MAGMGCQRCHGIKFVDIYHNDSVCECPSRLITREKLVELKEQMHNHKVVDDKAIVELSAKELEALIDFCEEQLDRRDNE